MSPPPHGLRRRTPLRHAGLVAALLAIAATAVVAYRGGAVNQLPPPGWVATATPLTNLLDGSTVVFNIKANPDVSINEVELRECRLGPTYVDLVDNSPSEGNCPAVGVSTSADIAKATDAAHGSITAAQSDAGLSLSFRVGVGVATWDGRLGQATLTCDPSNPCALLARIRVGPNYLYQVFTLNFTDADPVKACGGTAPGVLQAEASDELTDAWANWTRAYCQANPGGAPSTTAFPSEGSAVSTFSLGAADIAYGSLGFDSASGMLPPGVTTRNTIAVPIALNAAVLAVGSGHRPSIGADKEPYPQLQMLAGDAAGLLSGGKAILQNSNFPYSSDISASNPGLAGITYWTGANNPLASSLVGTSTWLLTSFFTHAAPSDWVDQSTNPPTPRGATSSLAFGFNSINTLSGRPAMQKITVPAALNDPDGPLWVYTDNATAAALNLTPVAIDTGASGFVAPTADSMAAAVGTMKAGNLGVLEPDFSATAAVQATAVAPYPLTYVMYAFVPAEPLVDTVTCTPRTASQTLLTNWLQYITGPGQQNMAPGLQPLPPSLLTTAQDAITKVGASPVTGACASSGSNTPPTTTGSGGGGTSGIGTATGSTGAGTTSGSLPSSGSVASGALPASGVVPKAANIGNPGGASTSAGASAGSSAQSAATKPEQAVAVPAFAGHRIDSPVGGVVALIGIVLVMTLGAWITAGGRLSTGGMWAPGSLGALTPGRIGSLALLWGGIAIAGIGLVVFQLGPLLEQRDQRSLLSDYRVIVEHAANERGTLAGIKVATKPPETGSAVGVLEIGALKTQDVVLEGVTASDTSRGPGHVPGTAGLGQPGNSVVVARRNGYGATFRGLDTLQEGDRVVVTTTQGQAVYAVSCVTTATIDGETVSTSSSSTSTSTSSDFACPRSHSKTGSELAGTGASTTTTPSSTSTTASGETTTTAEATSSTTTTPAATSQSSAYTAAATSTSSKSSSVTVDTLYGPTNDDRLTLVTSGSKMPWNTSKATVVLAKLLGKPYPPTPQGARSADETGFASDSGAWAAVVLAMLAFIGVIVASVALYRRMRFRVAYVLTIAPLVAFTVIAGETLARLLPAWT